MSAERLQKVLASAGIASRRDCEALIDEGRVAVNGKTIRLLGARVDPEQDEITVDGRPIGRLNPRTYVMLNKPTGVVSTADDPQGRPTVVAMVDLPARLFPVGRLDYDSEGLLLLTDDGELTQRLTHPSYEVEKEYRALLDQPPSPDAIREWRAGVLLDGTPTAPAWVDIEDRDDDGVWVRVVLHEGRKRQIRAVAGQLGYQVLRLIRVREGPLVLGDLSSGQWRQLTDEEVEQLWAHVGGRDSEPPAEEQEYGAAPRAPRNAPRGSGAGAARKNERSPVQRGSDRGPRNTDRPRDDRGPRRDDRSFDNRGPRRDDDRGSQRDDYQERPRDDRSFDNRGPRRDDNRDRPRDDRSFDNRGPRRDDRSFDNRGPRRDDNRSFDNRGPRRDDNRSFDNRGPRRDDNRSFDNRGPRRDDNRSFDNR
ncbi:MAG TPA: pseudouridine synthase, partial [Roseiflexaceae bacterium]|nr:pseudouridine synthase [Roseiflexaceae bacterium]